MQLEAIDEQLKNGLWSIFYDLIVQDGRKLGFAFVSESEYKTLLGKLWRHFYKLPTGTIPYENWAHSVDIMRESFYKELEWYKVYDLIEFVAKNISPTYKKYFVANCNVVLQREMAGYRFVEDEITRITSEEQIAEIEQAINEANTNAVSSHLKRSLELLSDRAEPDYRNSIKESISAVEALCVKLTGDSSATLGQALKRLEADGAIKTHPALNRAFQQIYGYTSDAGGIRHALLEEDSLEFEDAKFMLVSCSAFVNYLQAKAAKSG